MHSSAALRIANVDNDPRQLDGPIQYLERRGLLRNHYSEHIDLLPDTGSVVSRETIQYHQAMKKAFSALRQRHLCDPA